MKRFIKNNLKNFKYYYKDNDKLSARAFTMFFKDFKRE